MRTKVGSKNHIFLHTALCLADSDYRMTPVVAQHQDASSPGHGSGDACNYEVDVPDATDQHSRAVSELSSVDTVDTVDRLGRDGECERHEESRLSQLELLTGNAMLSAQQRRTMRRQWNPSFYSTSSWARPYDNDHPDDLLPFSRSQQVRNVDCGDYDRTVPPVGNLKNPEADFTMPDDPAKNDPAPISLSQLVLQDAPSSNTEGECDYDDNGHLRSDSTNESIAQTTSHCAYTRDAAPDSKYRQYACLVDSSHNDQSLEIHLYSFKRPHMRAFHLAWISFFTAFFTWFSITPLLAEVERSLHLTREEIWTSSIFAVAGSALTRILIGPICDKYGARWSMAGTLFVSAIPTALTGLAQSAQGLYVLRLFIGVAGSSFVTCQYWTSTMFTVEVAGTANALVAGWGNLGGGVTQIVMGSLLFPILKVLYGSTDTSSSNAVDGVEYSDVDRPSDLAWRTAFVIPALACLVVSYVVIKYTDDSPKGNYRKRSQQGFMAQVSTMKSIGTSISNINTWILFVQYGCCFGVEITMINAAALYFQDVFHQSTEAAAAIASIFGWMNLFARGLGGFFSDYFNSKHGVRGRLWVQVTTLVLEGILVIIFGQTHTLASAIGVMIVLSIFVQAAAGSTFSIVPYVNPTFTGSIAGIVGAGGNVGGVVFAIIFRNYDYARSFLLMGAVAMASALLSVVFIIRDHTSICVGAENGSNCKSRISHDVNPRKGHSPSNTDLPDHDLVDGVSLPNSSKHSGRSTQDGI